MKRKPDTIPNEEVNCMVYNLYLGKAIILKKKKEEEEIKKEGKGKGERKKGRKGGGMGESRGQIPRN